MTENPSKPQKSYVVELSLEMPEAEVEPTVAGWELLLSGVSQFASGGLLLQSMPAIKRSPAGDPGEIRLRWVGIHADSAEDAIAQARAYLDQLATFLPAVASPVSGARACEEGSAS
jgi:hypothetical protein